MSKIHLSLTTIQQTQHPLIHDTLNIDTVIIEHTHLYLAYLALTVKYFFNSHWTFCNIAPANLTHDVTHNNLLVKSASVFSFMQKNESFPQRECSSVNLQPARQKQTVWLGGGGGE